MASTGWSSRCTEMRPALSKFRKKATTFILDNFLPLGLIFFIIFGALWPGDTAFSVSSVILRNLQLFRSFSRSVINFRCVAPGILFSQGPTQYICIFFIFVLNGLKLKTGAWHFRCF